MHNVPYLHYPDTAGIRVFPAPKDRGEGDEILSLAIVGLSKNQAFLGLGCPYLENPAGFMNTWWPQKAFDTCHAVNLVNILLTVSGYLNMPPNSFKYL